MRRVTATIFIILLLLALPVTAFASVNSGSTTVTGTIPSQHTITLSGSHVQLFYRDVTGSTLVIPHHEEPGILLVTEPGYAVSQVLFGGQDITASYQGGIVTLPRVWKDDVLTVVTQKAGPVGRTDISGTVQDKDGKPISGATVTIHNPGTSVTTGSGGGYSFTDVPLGGNIITVTRPDGVTDTVSISIVEGDTLSVTYANGIYTIVLPKGATGLNVGLGFDAQDNLVITGVSAVWPYFAAFGENPRTGDIIRFWIATLALSGLGLLGVWFCLKKRTKDEI